MRNALIYKLDIVIRMFIYFMENNPTKRIIAEALIIKNSQTFPENKPSFDLNVF